MGLQRDGERSRRKGVKDRSDRDKEEERQGRRKGRTKKGK